MSVISNVPESPPKDGIIVISGGLDVLEGGVLSAAETHRANAISHPESRARFAAARRILRSVLSRWTDIHPLKLEIIPDENGKPSLLANDPIHFSISHSSDRVAVAFSRDSVGLDLEQEREVDASALATRFFSLKEAEWFEGSTNPALFFKLWTCREAAIKGDGRGLSKLLGITRVDFLGEGNAAPVEVQIGSERWEAIHWKVEECIHGALAFQKKPTLISWCDLR